MDRVFWNLTLIKIDIWGPGIMQSSPLLVICQKWSGIELNWATWTSCSKLQAILLVNLNLRRFKIHSYSLKHFANVLTGICNPETLPKDRLRVALPWQQHVFASRARQFIVKTYLTSNSRRTTLEQQAANTRKIGIEGCIFQRKGKVSSCLFHTGAEQT